MCVGEGVLSLPFCAWVLEGPRSPNQGIVLPSDLPLTYRKKQKGIKKKVSYFYPSSVPGWNPVCSILSSDPPEATPLTI